MKPKDTNGLLMQDRFWEEQHKVTDQLREVGLEKYIELPTIAVMCDRSSGKSSLLSALSGISFPLNDQLTTRCPTQLNLTRGDVFHGTVRLVRFQTGSDREQMEATEDLKQLEDVPNAISKFTKKTINDGLIISNDQIVIEVCGPEIPELTLVDLPGLVRTAKKLKDKSMIPRVQKMVDRYMKKEQIVVIAVVPANKDMHNSEILKTVQAADPDGTRTIAVVTKLDLVNAGAEKTVLEFLLNKNKQMHLGYHAVKCRNQRDLTTGMSIEIGLANERTFFSQHEYWSQLPSHLWGIPTLTKRLISILQDNTRKTFQNAIAKMTSRLIETKEKLSRLGPPLDTPGAQRQQFCEWVKQYLQLTEAAKNGHYELFTSIHGLIDTDIMAKLRLRALLRQEDLNFRSEIETTTTEDVLKFIDFSSSAPLYDSEELKKARNDVKRGDRIVVQRGDQIPMLCTYQGKIKNSVLCKEFPLRVFSPSQWKYPSSTTNANLKQFIRANRGDELAVFPSYRVFCSCVKESIKNWDRPALKLLDQYLMKTKRVSYILISAVLAGTENVQIEHLFKQTTDRVLKTLENSAKQELHVLLQQEARPYTQNEILYYELDQLRQRALYERLSAAFPRGNQSGMVCLADVMLALGEVLTKIFTYTREDRQALQTENALRAYLKLASHRFVDVVPMKLDNLLLKSFLTEMETALIGAVTVENVAELFRESAEKAAHRQEFLDQVAMYEKGTQIIEMSEYY